MFKFIKNILSFFIEEKVDLRNLEVPKFDYTCEILQAIDESDLSESDKNEMIRKIERHICSNPHKFFSKENYEYIVEKLKLAKNKRLYEVVNEIKSKEHKENDTISVYYVKDNNCNFVYVDYIDSIDVEKHKDCIVKDHIVHTIENSNSFKFFTTCSHLIEIRV